MCTFLNIIRVKSDIFNVTFTKYSCYYSLLLSPTSFLYKGIKASFPLPSIYILFTSPYIYLLVSYKNTGCLYSWYRLFQSPQFVIVSTLICKCRHSSIRLILIQKLPFPACVPLNNKHSLFNRNSVHELVCKRL